MVCQVGGNIFVPFCHGVPLHSDPIGFLELDKAFQVKVCNKSFDIFFYNSPRSSCNFESLQFLYDSVTSNSLIKLSVKVLL